MAKGRPGGGPENLRPPWSSTNQPKNKNGRKPSSVKKFIKDNNLNYYDVSAMAKYILPLDEDQLKEILLDKKTPFVMRLFAKSVMEDLKKGNLNNVMTLIERAVGKPKEIQEVYDSSGGPPETKEERESRISELLEKRNATD